MADRFSVAQRTQVGVEVTPGTAVAANRRLRAMGFGPSVNVDVSEFVPPGMKFATLEVEGREWASAPMSGRPTYTELIYPLAMITHYATPVTAAGVTTWTFQMDPDLPDPIKTLTIERGDSVIAERSTYGLLTELNLNVTRQVAEMSGQVLSRALEIGATLTGSPTSVPLVPIMAKQFSFFIDATSVGLGTTRLTRVLRVNFGIGNRFGPIWTVDASQPSFAAHAELLPNIRLETRLGADTVGMGFLTHLRAGDQLFGELLAEGPDIGVTSTPYSFKLDAALQVMNVANMGDSDGIYGVDVTFKVVFDNTWNKACVLEVVNDVTAL